MMLNEYLRLSSQYAPNKAALVTGTKRYTYAELERSARGFAAYLKRSGLQRGDRVAIYLENSVEAVVSIFGTLEAGGCFVVVNHTAPPARLGFILEHCAARFLVSPGQRVDQVQKAVASCSRQPQLIVTGEHPDLHEAASFGSVCVTEPLTAEERLIDLDLAAIIYTSGSTGEPKGVSFAHRSISAVVESIREYLQNHSEDVILNVLPLSFGYGLLQLLVTFRTGGRLILEKGFGFPYEMVNRIKEERVTGFAGVPTIFAILTQLETLANEDLSSLRYITNAAAGMPPPFIPKLRRIFPSAKIFLMHGLTECLRTTFLPPEEIDRRPTSVGRGMPNVELWIEDAEGNRLSPGETGELVVRGSNIMLGYWKDPSTTATVIRQGRYPWERTLHTGDLFTMDEDGFFYFVARRDEVIKSRGERISPKEIEDVLYQLNEVHEVRVIGVPDPILGQAIRAEIVLKDGHVLDERQVKRHCKENLEDFKTPSVIAFVRAIPKTAGGKIRRTGEIALSS